MPKTHKKRYYAKKTKTKTKTKTKVKAGYVSATARAMIAALEARITHNIGQLRQLLARIAPTLTLKSREYKDYINNVSTSYEYNHKNIPIVLLRLITRIHTVLERVNHLLRCHNEPAFLEAELERNGYNDMVTFIDLTLTNMEELEERMQRHTQNSLDDYNISARYGVEIIPTIRNRTNRRIDATVTPLDGERGRALTRRTRTI